MELNSYLTIKLVLLSVVCAVVFFVNLIYAFLTGESIEETRERQAQLGSRSVEHRD